MNIIRNCFLLCLFVFAPFVAAQQNAINLNSHPFVPSEFSGILSHRSMDGVWVFNPQEVVLWTSKNQCRTGGIRGTRLRGELRGKRVLNANVLDFLLAHQELIPKEWRGKSIYFWGTIYVDSRGNSVVRCMYYHSSGQWDWYTNNLREHWSNNDPAAVLQK
jgi:hypothetical protein